MTTNKMKKIILLVGLGIIILLIAIPNIRVAYLKHQVSKLKEETSSIEALNAEISNLREKNEALEAEKVSLEEKVGTLTSEKAALEKENAALKGNQTAPTEQQPEQSEKPESLDNPEDYWNIIFWQDPYNYKIDEGQAVYSDIQCSQKLDVKTLDTNIYVHPNYPLENGQEVYVYRSNGQFVYSLKELSLTYNEPSSEE